MADLINGKVMSNDGKKVADQRCYRSLPMKKLAVALLPLAFACIPNETLVLPDAMVSECTGDVPQTMRVASYNVKSGAMTSLAEIGDVIVQINPDVVAL